MLIKLRRIAMLKLCRIKKLLTMLICSVLSVGVVTAYSSNDLDHGSVAAKTIGEIQEERKQNEEEIAALEQQIQALEGDKADKKAYQETLSEQILIIQNDIKLLYDEMDQIKDQISTAEVNINDLNTSITQQQSQVDENIELFKERLCAMYVTGNDTIASAIFGSTDFYDMLSRYEMVNCIAEHDEELINTILDEISNLEKSKSDLETEKLTLEMKQDELEVKKEEKDAAVENLNEKFALTTDEIERLELEQDRANQTKAEREAEQKRLDAQEAEIRAAEEAARKAEEERLAKEAAERKAAQEAAEKAAQQNNANNTQTVNDNSSDNNNTAPDPEPVVQNVTPTASGFAWPAPGYYAISSPYGSRWGTTHRGIDISGGGIAGASACASQSGTVIAVSNSCSHNYAKSSNCCGNGYGNYVIISHGDGYTTLYGHLESVNVSVGESVSQGQVIGAIGTTGFSTGYHLHFEVRINGEAVDPMGYVG